VLYYEFHLARERHVPFGDLVERGLVFLQLARVTACQLYIAVQNVQGTLAYKIHEFFVTLRNDSFTHSQFGRFQHLERD